MRSSFFMKKNQTSPVSIRPELTAYKEYLPGLSIQEIQRRYGLKNVVKLASNENSMGPSPKTIQAFKEASAGLYRYPESRSTDLRALVAGRFQVDLGQVIIGAGSDEIIELLAKAFLTPFDEIIVSASAFIQYRLAGQLMGARVTEIPMKNFKHDVGAMARAATERTKFVFIANPNNPTGTYNTREEMKEFLSKLPETAVPVIDEAYFEYATVRKDYPSMIKEFFKKRPMVVLRTFSKAYGLAGLRVGYGIAPDSMVRVMDKIRQPFNVSVAAQAAALAALQDQAYIAACVRKTEGERAQMIQALQKMNISVVPSATNFLLISTAPRTGRAVFEKLLQKGLIARCVDEYGLPDYLRVTIGLPKENKLFIDSLREVLKDL